MAGNGYFDTNLRQYVPNSVETWADYDASSTGNDWDAFTEWRGTPSLPLTYTTGILDYGSSATVNYLCSVDSNYPVYITVKYGDTVDSTGGAIDSPSTLSVSPSQTLSAVKARYFQFTISVDRDSASEERPFISSVTTAASQDLVTRYLTDINTRDLNTVSDDIGASQAVYYELPSVNGLSKIVSCVTQPHTGFDYYVNSDYVNNDDSSYSFYVMEEPVIPNISIDKSVDPIRIMVLDISRQLQASNYVHCIFDAVVQGLPALSSDANGNIVQG